MLNTETGRGKISLIINYFEKTTQVKEKKEPQITEIIQSEKISEKIRKLSQNLISDKLPLNFDRNAQKKDWKELKLNCNTKYVEKTSTEAKSENNEFGK